MKIYFNFMFNFCITFVFIIGNYQWVKAAFIPKCPLHQQHFSKILGYRPNLSLFTNVLKRGYSFNLTNGINLECWTQCNDDIDCTSYVLFVETSECYGFSKNEKSFEYQYLPERYELISDSNAIFFEKICLNVPKSCNLKQWPIVRILGSSLVGQGYKQINNLVTRKECSEKCVFETEFRCLSASFVVSHKNNLYRDEKHRSRLKQELDELGQCTLSRDDKTTRSESFRVADYDEEYIENQCVERASSNVFCSFEQYTNSNFIYSEYKESGLTQKECQERCTWEKRFYCHGVTYSGIAGNKRYSSCFYHSEDTISLGPRAIGFQNGATYMRRVKCLNVTVICGKKAMTVEYKPTHWFRGRMYVNSHSEDCSITGQGTNATILKIPIGNEILESKCGIIRAYTINDPWNRTLISTLIVIQQNYNIQTQGDRLIRVGCILNNNINDDGVPDDIALGSSIEFDRGQFTNVGSLVVNETGKLPTVTMKIVDVNDQNEINDVQLGQNLEFILNVEPPNSSYDIRAMNLIAQSNNGDTKIILLDDRGCPPDISVFPALTRIKSNNVHSFRARFHAFKFVASAGVKFDVLIHFCMYECQPIDCGIGVPSFGRRRKREVDINYKILNIVNGPPSMQPIFFPKETINPIKFPNGLNEVERKKREEISEPKAMAYEIVVNGKNKTNKFENSYSIELEDSPYNIYQSVIGSYQNETVHANVSETTRNNFTDFRRILKKPIELGLNLEIKVHNNKEGETESLIYGENSQILVAGVDFESNSNMLCLAPGVIITILAFWILLQVILMTGCCIIIKRYRKLAELEEDRRSLHRIHQSLDTDSYNRRVRWADQGNPLHSQVVYAT